MVLTRVKAILWLHTLRLWRYRWSFLNLVLAEAAWVFLFVLGALLFVPGEYLGLAVKSAFWTIVAWTIISQCSSLIGAWMNFFISIGMVEEHILRGISPFKVILGRVVTSFSVILVSLLFISAILNGVFKTNVWAINDPYLLTLSFIALALQGLAYGITIAAISVKTSIPHNMLEIVNFAVIGLLMIPLDRIPGLFAIPFLCVPYVASAHLAKIGASGAQPYMLLEALNISLLETLVMLTIAIYVIKKSEEWIKKNGVRAIGFF
ncbi:MAG: hypothetical protein DRJ38_05000 [Thermoprotei archaeon]|nr:MAG: hypothetical protein DRJ38_05000 [Thermoprotei archaeon]